MSRVDRKLTQFGDDVESGVETLAKRTGAQSDDMADTAARQLQSKPGTIAGYSETSKAISDGLYKQADNLGGGAMIAPTRTVTALDKIEARLALSPGTQESRAAIASLRQELASQQWTVEGLRQLRTTYGKKLNATDGVTRMDSNALWAELSRDITDGLHRAGKGEAARAYRTADRFYAKRAETKAIVEKIIGGARGGPLHSAEQVAKKLEQMSRTGADDLNKVLRQLPRQEADDVRGNLIRQLGMANPSRQSDVPTFSIQSFGTAWSKLSPRAKATMFDRQTVKDLDDLATLASAAKSIPGNTSNSFVGAAMSVGAQATAGYVAYQNAGEPTTWLAVAATMFAGGMLGNRRLTRAMVNWGRTGKSAPLERALSVAAKRAVGNPALQQEIAGVRAMIQGKVERPAPVQQESAQPSGSIFDDGDDASDEAAPHPFAHIERDADEDDEPEEDGRTAAQRVADGEGDEPIY